MKPDAGARPIFIAEVEQFGGAERSLLALSRWLFGQGLPNYLLTYRDGCDIGSYSAAPLPVVDLNAGPGVRSKVAALRRHLQARPGNAPALLCSGYQPALHATLAGVRGFHTLMHDTPALFGDSGRRSLNGKLRVAVSNRIVGFGLRSGGRTLVNSEFLQAECCRDFGVTADIVRMGGLSSRSSFQRKPGRIDGSLSMLSVCRIEANKRIDWLLRALSALEQAAVAPLQGRLSEMVDWQLELVGKGSSIPELSALAEFLGISDRVRFHGFVSDADLESFYAEADLFLMPAMQGYGIPAVEALDWGIPVLLHRESGVSDLLLNTPWATVQQGGENNTISALANAIDDVLRGDYLRVSRPQIPTEDEWAGAAAELCGWT